jgi:hypothetical protein
LPKNSTPCASSASLSSKTNLHKNKYETSPKLETKKLDSKNKKLNMDICSIKNDLKKEAPAPPLTRSKAAEIKTRSNSNLTDSKVNKPLASSSISKNISTSSLNVKQPVKTTKPHTAPPTKARTLSSIAGTAPVEKHSIKKIAVLEKPVQKTPIKPKITNETVPVYIQKEYISTPKNAAQKEELANEFKKLNLSVKKTIKHFEELSNSLNNSSTNIATTIVTTADGNDEDELSVKYFRKLIETKTKQLLDLSDEWCLICRDQADIIPDSIQGDIRSTCGLAKLLMEERFKQFAELIDQCESTNTNSVDPEIKIVKCTDLQGFWEMINHQVKDVENQFAKLTRIKQNNYSDEQEFVPRIKKTAIRKTSSLVESKENAKPVVKSKFSEFRAKLKVKTVETDLMISNVVETSTTTTTTTTEVVLTEQNTNVETVSVEEHSKVKKRPVVRSRPSDLIKFDSPVPAKKNNYNEQAIAEDSENDENIQDKENDPFDFESFVPIGWNKNSRESSATALSFSPKTPSRSNDRKSQFNDLVNSPLLKLALVSSHGKSKSVKKN